LRDEYIAKTEKVGLESVQEIINARKDRVTAMYKLYEKPYKDSDLSNNLLKMAEGISIDLMKKEGSRRVSVTASIKEVFLRLRDLGFIHPKKNKAIGNSSLQYLNDDEIVSKYNSIILGLLN